MKSAFQDSDVSRGMPPAARAAELDPRDDFLWAQAACVLGTWLALVFWRLSFGWPRHRLPRLAASVLCSLAVVGLAVWMLNGPLAPGWGAHLGDADRAPAGRAPRAAAVRVARPLTPRVQRSV